MRLIKIAALIFLLISHFPLSAQYFSTGDDPANIKWLEIRTPNFQIIFPEEYEEKAQQVAYIFEQVYNYGYRTLEHPPKKSSVILHTHTVKSNGLVAWSPKRVELFTTPHQKIFAQDWIEQLAIHEFRHVVQMDKIQSELPALLPMLFGEQVAAAVVGAYLPFWFIEGDAVMTETALTHAGRGRLPSFLMENKAQAVEKGLFSYDKSVLGSYNDFVPNRYKFGYWFSGGIRQQYGTKIWSDVLTEIGKNPFSVNPVNKILKKETGMTKEKLYQNLYHEYLDEWQSEVAILKQTNQKQISPSNNSFVNYKYVSALSGSSVIAYKESREDIGRIVSLDNENERVIFTPGSIFDESLSRTGDMLIWSEKRPDLRWTHADRSVIVIYNTKTKIKKELHSDHKLFSPVISPDLNSFAAVEVDNTNNYHLTIFDLVTGSPIHQYSTPDNHYFFTPCWSSDGKMIYFVGLSEKGKYIGSLNPGTGIFAPLTTSNFYDIRNPEFHDQNLYFTSSKTGIDNLFCLDLETMQIKQISSVRFGADYPSVENGQLYFSNYCSEGYGVAVLDLKDALGKQDKEIDVKTYEPAESLAGQEDMILNFSGATQLHYQTKPYRKLAHLFNFHSWAPAYINVNDYDIKPGVSLMSQNKLGTASTHLGYEYNISEDAGKYKVDFEYSGLFPIISLQSGYGKRKSEYLYILNSVDDFGNIVKSDTTIRSYSWNEFDLDLGIKTPLYFSHGKYTQILQPELEYSYRKIIHDHTAPDQFYSGYYHSLSYRLYFQNMIRKSELDIVPDWGQIIELTYRNSPTGGTNLGNLSAVQSYLYFPGLTSNHGIKLYNGFQIKNTNANIAFSDIVKYPRGFNRFQNDELYSFTADYMMPICYPDFSLGRLFYLKRLRTSLFYDFANLKGTIYNEEGLVQGTYSGDLKSLGVELTGDGHVLRLVAPVSVGVRGIYLPDIQDFRFEFLFSISFESL